METEELVKKNAWTSPREKPPKYKPVIVAIEVHTADGTTEYDTVQAFLNGRDEWIASNYNHTSEKITHRVVAYMLMPTYPG